nr:zinc finger CCCH domain-containing protein 7 [Ipomoea batatas]
MAYGSEVGSNAKLPANSMEGADTLDDDTFSQNSNIQSHLNLALLGVEEDSVSVSSIEQHISLEDYLRGSLDLQRKRKQEEGFRNWLIYEMDPFHHHQRYVQRPPPPPPPNFPDSPNCFNHRPPPPHPNLHPPLPPPRHYHHRLPPPPPPRRFSFHPENPQFFDFVKNRDSPPTPHSIPTLEPWSDLSPRFPPPQPLHHRQTPFLLPLNDQTDNSRFIRDDRVIKNNGFRANRSIANQEPLWGRKDSGFDDDDDVDKFRFKSGFRRPSIQHRLDIRDDREEDLRWGYRDVNDVLDSSSRRLSLDNSSYGYDERRFSNRVREGVEEYRRSPRNKYMQKKSAPLRIQLGKTNNRIRYQDRHYSRGFVDNSSLAGSRGKEKDGNAWAGKRVEERESSPVELDVSFKSNALVAKPIVAPSSPAVQSDKNLTPRVPKARKLRMSGSPPTKWSEDFGKCENSANGSDCPLNYEKGSRELEDNVSGTEKASTSVNNACIPMKNTVLDRGKNAIGNDGSPLRKIRHKKKVMTSVMEKTGLLQKESGVNPVSANRSSNNPSSVSQLDDDTIHEEERIVSHDLSKGMNCVKEDKVTAPENADNSSYRGQLHEGSSRNDISVRGDLGTGSYVTTPKNLKKRKCSSPALGHTILSETFEGLDEVNMPEPPTEELSIGDNAITCTESQVENCCAALSPCIQPMVTLHDNSTNRGSFLGESDGDGFLGDLSKLEQVPSFPSDMGAGEKESTSVVSKGNNQDGPLGMATKICEEKFTSSMDDMVPTEGDSECHNGLSTSNFSDEMTGPIPDASTIKSSPFQVSNEVDSEVDPTDNELMVSSGDILSFSVKTSSDNSKVDGYAVNAISSNHPMKITASPSPPDSYKPSTVSISSSQPDTFKPPQSLKSVPSKSILSKNKMSPVLPRGYSGSSSVSFITSRKAALPTHVAKPRTWHRTGNSSSVTGSVSIVSSIPPRSQSPNDTMNIRNSYIRKGNSLVRNLSNTGTVAHGYHASSSSVYRLNSSSIKDGKKFKSDNVVDTSDPSSCTKTSGSNTLSQRLNCKPLNCTSNNLGNPTPLPVADQSGSGSLGRELDGLELTAVMSVQKCSEDAAKSFQCLADSVNKLETQNTSDEGNSRKKLLYLKRRSNQLVAAPDTTPTSSSDGYYKRRKNQLVRTITENHVKQGAAVVDDGLNSERQVAEKAITKKQTVLPNVHNRSKFSLVWTLNGTKSSREDGSSFNHKVRPYMFPWKRATNLRSFVQSLGSIPNDHSISTIRQKLLFSRKRDTVYTRSAYGLSLRRSQVLSVCGASLKWSKSIERNSRKANQEATLAVAAAEKRKRGQNSIAPSNSNRRNNVSRERIFRIGSERYKMDPTGKTLQRISSDEEPAEDAPQSESNAKTSYIPRRLLIGNDEYVRIGNGNKLVRNPKRRVRILANQKVRWSLHTARLRLAKKKKYCQFFTRFGKCNKDNGKCPYIHDPSKIAVCTKFLSGSCSNLDCKLTHKVIPERMQDCSYFLQGLCSNESCPYRHVNVNPNSSVCEGFLRGYCSDGNEVFCLVLCFHLL